MLDRRGFIASLGAALQTERRPRPNLLFIVVDQWRGQALPSAGDPNLVAPNLARLAREGVDFRRAYTTYPVCCPSRAAMLTGKFPHAAGVTRNHTELPMAEETFSAQLKRAGYRTGYIGKWHLDGRSKDGFVPPERRRGFDYWAAHNIAHQHYGAVYFRDTPDPIPAEGFQPDGQADLAIDFIRQESASPFFLYLALVAPHPPLTPPPRHANYDPTKIQLRPNVPPGGADEVRKNSAAYYALCSAVDENLGRIFGELDRLGMAEDTIVVFTADHGWTLGSHGLDVIDSPYEEASKIPLILRYPRRLKPRTEEEMLVSNVDYAPTLLSLCGVDALKSTQGVDHSRWLMGGGKPRPTPIFAEGELGTEAEWRMVVNGRDKLVVDHTLKPIQLFDLRRDPYELRNLVAVPSAQRKRDALLGMIREWMSRTSGRVLYEKKV